jgi:hypothetical protein
MMAYLRENQPFLVGLAAVLAMIALLFWIGP